MATYAKNTQMTPNELSAALLALEVRTDFELLLRIFYRRDAAINTTPATAVTPHYDSNVALADQVAQPSPVPACSSGAQPLELKVEPKVITCNEDSSASPSLTTPPSPQGPSSGTVSGSTIVLHLCAPPWSCPAPMKP